MTEDKPPVRPSDLGLLELRTLDLSGGRARVVGLRGFVIARTRSAEVLWIGSEVPDDLARALQSAHGDARPLVDHLDQPDPPSTLEICARLLSEGGWNLGRQAGPTYLFESHARLASGAQIERSDASSTADLRGANPGNWHPIEWNELLDGRLGPWAMALLGGRIVSICHTPVPLTDSAAVAGVWTHPDFRGQGHASAVTSEWADILRPSGRHLFYNTNTENLSSRRVAARLKLRLLGWLWTVGELGDGADDRYHPLSQLRRGRRVSPESSV